VIAQRCEILEVGDRTEDDVISYSTNDICPRISGGEWALEGYQAEVIEIS
jgi:uncharacterized cupin superfamily protein